MNSAGYLVFLQPRRIVGKQYLVWYIRVLMTDVLQTTYMLEEKYSKVVGVNNKNITYLEKLSGTFQHYMTSVLGS